MHESLKTSLLKLAYSKKSRRLRFIYYTKALIFYPFLVYDERYIKSKGDGFSSAASGGDDVYPLF